MTTNSFGGALPRFDFPSQPAPAASRMARIHKALPVVLVAASVAAVALKTTQEARDSHASIPAMLFGRAPAQGLVPRGQGIIDKQNVDLGAKPNKIQVWDIMLTRAGLDPVYLLINVKTVITLLKIRNIMEAAKMELRSRALTTSGNSSVLAVVSTVTIIPVPHTMMKASPELSSALLNARQHPVLPEIYLRSIQSGSDRQLNMALSSTVEKDIAIACICSVLILSRCAYRIYHRYKRNGGSHRIWHADDIYMALALLPLTSRTVCVSLSFILNPSSSRLPVTKEEAAAQNTTVDNLEHDRIVGLSLLIGTRLSYPLVMWKLAPKEDQPVCQKGMVYFFALAAGNISTDIALLILPFPTLSMARLNTRTKIQLGILFSIGILVITITIVRVPLILGDAMSQKARSTFTHMV
ncbi:hypothetical protein FPCIR_12121 [Fusarium pseudocircinatum]|uniref:Rhodopsin domain-containing protein n=1 Tax=Fusarium pseudocircinatum TaxID=56676 RepID=A0A8H5KNA8_9HYPO|nr:hypothetical protein FPCIR_12121 [Fusarium pseudocircinatum]